MRHSSFVVTHFVSSRPMPVVIDQWAPLTNLSGSTRVGCTLEVPSGASNPVFTTSGGTGDAGPCVSVHGPRPPAIRCRPGTETIMALRHFAPCRLAPTITHQPLSRLFGLTLSGSFEGGTTVETNTPQANIANGRLQDNRTTLSMSVGSTGSDGTLSGYLIGNFGDGSGSTRPIRRTAMRQRAPTVSLTVTDNPVSRLGPTTATITSAGSGFSATSHYYDKGVFDYNYTNYTPRSVITSPIPA